MKLFNTKIGMSGIAITAFVMIMLLLSLYFFIRLSKNQGTLEQRGFRTLNQLGVAMKEKDTVIRKVVANSVFQKPTGSDKRLGTNSIKNYLFLTSSAPKKKPLDSLLYTDSENHWYNMSINNFITPLLARNEFFSRYVLLRNDTIVFSTFGGDANFSKEKFKKVETQNSLLSFSSLAGKSEGDSVLLIQAGFIQKVKIQGKDYLFFAVPVRLNAGPDWYLGGLIEEGTFLSWKRSLPSEILGIFTLTLLSIIFSFPILKVFLSGPLEKFSRMEVTMAGISLISGPILLVVLMSEVLLSNRLKDTNYELLKKLNETVKNEFIKESDLMLHQLKAYRNAGFEEREKPVTSILESDIEDLKPFQYRYFKAFFPADYAGNQPLYLTTYKNGEKSNVFTRDYFLHPDKYKKTIDGVTTWYNMEPVYSNTSGDWIIAFSMLSGKPEESKITAITSSMYSLKKPVLPDGYEFCLIEKSGRVWYDSEEILNLSDNLIEESNNDQRLIQALKSNATTKFIVKFNHQKHLLYISPVNKTQLFMVTLFDPARTNAMEALATTFVTVYFAFVYIILLLIVLIFKLFHYQTSKLKGKAYFFSWLTPKQSKSKIYKMLLNVNCSIILVLILLGISGGFRSISVAAFLLFFFLFIILHYTLIFFTLNYYKAKKAKPEETSTETPWRYLNIYAYFLFSWLVVSSFLPAFFIMSRFAAGEGKVYTISQEYDLAHKINERNKALRNFYTENYTKKSCNALFNTRIKKGLYYKAISGITPENSKKFKSDSIPELFSNQFVSVIRSNFYRIMGESTPLTFDSISAIRFLEDKNSNLALTFEELAWSSTGEKETVTDTLFSSPTGLGIYNPLDESDSLSKGVIAFWLIFVIVMFLFYLLVKYIVRRLFPYQELDDGRVDLEKFLDILRTNKKNAVVVSVQKPNGDTIKEYGWSYINLAKTDQMPINSNDENLIVVNFDKGIKSPVDLEKRLKPAESLLATQPVALWLSKTPRQLITSLTDLWKNEADQRIFKTHLRHFESLVSTMAIFYVKQIPTDTGILPSCEIFKSVLLREAEFNPDILEFIPFLALDFEDCWNNKNCTCREIPDTAEHCSRIEDFILKIQEFSHAYYRTTWNSLSNEEQFVLLDLAEDSVVNMNNREIIKSLLNKEILKLKDTIEIVSRSFRNFILTEVDMTEFDVLQKNIKITGNWSRMRIPLILVAISIAIFLFVTQQNFLSNLNTFLLSALTIAGTFLRFSGLFSKSRAG